VILELAKKDIWNLLFIHDESVEVSAAEAPSAFEEII
jgi:hypothetical protein